MNDEAIQKMAKRLAEFCVALSIASDVINACKGNMSAAMGYASAAVYAICWRIALVTRKPEDGDE